MRQTRDSSTRVRRGRGAQLTAFTGAALTSTLVVTSALVLVRCQSSAPPPKASPPAPPPPPADLVLTGGRVVTMDPEGAGQPTAIALEGGKIAAVGDDREIGRRIGAETRVIDLAGRTVVPGLADSHLHLEGIGMARTGVDLVGTNSVNEVRARVKKAVKAAKKGAWIKGRGWDQNDWAEYQKKGIKFPSAKDLDDLAPDNPIVLERIDGHAIWVSSKAMALAGVGPKTRSPPGGEIVKGKNGKPSGIFIDNATALIDAKVPAPSKDEVRTALILAQKDCLGAGLTQVHDMGVDRATLEVMRELDASGELRLRVYAMLDGHQEDLGGAMAAGPVLPADPSKRLTIRGVKFFSDGALGSRGALLLEPYSDDPKAAPTPLLAPEILEARIRSAKDAGFQVATHAIGDKANRMVLEIYERVFGSSAATARPRIEHAQIVHPEDLGRFAKGGVIASMQPTHATSDMPWAEQRLGQGRLAGAYAWRSLLTTGATIAAGSDAPVEDFSPILGLYAAVSRKDMFGSPEGGWLPGERMTPAQALRAFTRGAAIASFREEEAGRVKPGMLADLTVLDRDPLAVSEEELNRVRVMLTIVGGKIEFAEPGADAAPAKPAPAEPAPAALPPPAGTATTAPAATSTSAR